MSSSAEEEEWSGQGREGYLVGWELSMPEEAVAELERYTCEGERSNP